MKAKLLPTIGLFCAALSSYVQVAAGPRAAQDEDTGPPDSMPTEVHDAPTFLFEDGCIYGAVVSGWVLPGMAEGDAPARVHARVEASASVTCPRRPMARTRQVFDGTTPRTFEQLEGSIERALIVDSPSKRSCIYVPDLSLTERGLRIDRVTRMCATAEGKRVRVTGR